PFRPVRSVGGSGQGFKRRLWTILTQPSGQFAQRSLTARAAIRSRPAKRAAGSHFLSTPFTTFGVAMKDDPGTPAGRAKDAGALERLSAALGDVSRTKGLPPVERWNPAYCGEI